MPHNAHQGIGPVRNVLLSCWALEAIKKIGTEKNNKEEKKRDLSPQTILSSQEMYIKAIKGASKVWDDKKLAQTLQEFKKDPLRNEKYIEILLEEQKSRTKS